MRASTTTRRVRSAILLLLAALGPSAAAAARPGSAAAGAGTTDRQVLERHLKELARKVKPGKGFWEATYRKAKILVFAHERHDRMRIATPAANAEKLTKQDLSRLLEANYDRALDARFAISHGLVWSVYAHPLSSLSRRELEEALDQVVTLAENFGTTYASTDLVFGGPDGEN